MEWGSFSWVEEVNTLVVIGLILNGESKINVLRKEVNIALTSLHNNFSATRINSGVYARVSQGLSTLKHGVLLLNPHLLPLFVHSCENMTLLSPPSTNVTVI